MLAGIVVNSMKSKGNAVGPISAAFRAIYVVMCMVLMNGRLRGAGLPSARDKSLEPGHLRGYQALRGEAGIFLFRTTEYHSVT